MARTKKERCQRLAQDILSWLEKKERNKALVSLIHNEAERILVGTSEKMFRDCTEVDMMLTLKTEAYFLLLAYLPQSKGQIFASEESKVKKWERIEELSKIIAS